MLYYLHLLSDYGKNLDAEIFKAFNVFQYITFRAVAAGVTAFLLSLIFGNWVIRHLISLKLGQPIRSQEEVHRLHELHGNKAGTPTMGGVLLLGALLISVLLWARPTNPLVWLAIFSVVYLGALGFVDDYLKVTKKSSDGISSRLKFALQSLLAGLITAFFVWDPALSAHAAQLYVPFSKEPIIQNLGIFTFVLYLLVIVGSSNAVNLTDGWLHSHGGLRFRRADLRRGQHQDRAIPANSVCPVFGGAGRGLSRFGRCSARIPLVELPPGPRFHG